MYGWIWRHLPFGRPGKIIGSIGLIVAAAALLWYVVFPWAEPLLPFDDVQVTDQTDTGGQLGPDTPGAPGGAASPGPGAEPSLGEHEIPYPTRSNNPEPTPSR
jgi:hypothetical protein